MYDYTVEINGEAVTVNLAIDLTESFNMEELTDRIDELREYRTDKQDEFDSMPENIGVDFEQWIRNEHDYDEDDANELLALEEIAAELEGMGGDHEWEGNWYPQEVIHENDFESRMDDMVSSCYEMPKDMPSWMSIKLDYDALKQDYTEHSFEGNTFLVR